MKNDLIANTLRYYRKQENLSIKDVVLLLEEKNIPISPKTIYAWENGTTKPNVPTLMILCSLYHIPNIQELLDPNDTDFSKGMPVYLSPDEQTLIAQYRKHPELQAVIQKILT